MGSDCSESAGHVVAFLANLVVISGISTLIIRHVMLRNSDTIGISPNFYQQ